MTNLFQIFSDTAQEAPLWPQPFCIYNNPETKCTWLFGLLTVSCREPITYDQSDFVAGTQGGHVCMYCLLLLLLMLLLLLLLLL